MLIHLWAGHIPMALRPDIDKWARDALDCAGSVHRGPGFNEVHVDVAGQTIGVSCAPVQTTIFTRALLPTSSVVVGQTARVEVCDSLPDWLWKASPIRYGDIDGRGGVAGSEDGDLAVAWNSGQFILSIMDRRTMTVVYAKDGGFHPSEVGGPLRTPLHWLVNESGRAFLHAAAVVADDKAVLVVGPSGAGKSTFTAQALQAGLPIIGDDYVVMATESVGAVAMPAYRTVKSKADSPLPGAGPHFDLANGKKARLIDDEYLVKKAPIVAVIVVDSEGPVIPESIDGAAAARILATSTVLQVPLYADHTLKMASAIASRVPCFRLGWLDCATSTRLIVEELVTR